jgi:hypothetical protein
LNVPVYQYDPFDLRIPVCARGKTYFHAEGVAGSSFIDADGRRFDSIEKHVIEKGHAGQKLVMKMDVEGAEWPSLLNLPDNILTEFVQIVIEIHGLDVPGNFENIRKVLGKLNEHFYVAHLHSNNCCCSTTGFFPSSVIEVLYVNKSVAVVTDLQRLPSLPNAQDESNTGNAECKIEESLFL